MQVTGDNNNIIVLELFTSQGCSSCPPADRLLGTYADRANIAALSFHVDYWNRLGWKDPFSDPAYSARQQDYAASFGPGSVYTPQLIINGEKEMVGSDEDKIAATVQQMQGPAYSQITMGEIATDGNKVSLRYSLSGKINNAVVNIALVQKKTTTSIKAGENKGVTLTNYNVVRNFKTIDSLSAGENMTTIELAAGVPKEECIIVIYLQDVVSRKIFAAAKSGL